MWSWADYCMLWYEELFLVQIRRPRHCHLIVIQLSDQVAIVVVYRPGLKYLRSNLWLCWYVWLLVHPKTTHLPQLVNHDSNLMKGMNPFLIHSRSWQLIENNKCHRIMLHLVLGVPLVKYMGNENCYFSTNLSEGLSSAQYWWSSASCFRWVATWDIPPRAASNEVYDWLNDKAGAQSRLKRSGKQIMTNRCRYYVTVSYGTLETYQCNKKNDVENCNHSPFLFHVLGNSSPENKRYKKVMLIRSLNELQDKLLVFKELTCKNHNHNTWWLVHFYKACSPCLCLQDGSSDHNRKHLLQDIHI